MGTPESTPADDLVVTHDESAHRFEGRLEGRVVAVADYVPQWSGPVPVVAMVHTEVDPEHEHQGLATKVVDTALREARARGWRVVPACSFVRLHVRRHAQEYADVL